MSTKVTATYTSPTGIPYTATGTTQADALAKAQSMYQADVAATSKTSSTKSTSSSTTTSPNQSNTAGSSTAATTGTKIFIDSSGKYYDINGSLLSNDDAQRLINNTGAQIIYTTNPATVTSNQSSGSSQTEAPVGTYNGQSLYKDAQGTYYIKNNQGGSTTFGGGLPSGAVLYSQAASSGGRTAITLGNGQVIYEDSSGIAWSAPTGGTQVANSTVAGATEGTQPTTTPATGTGLTYNTQYGVSQDQWNQMNDVQRATIAAAYTAKQQAYNTDGQQLTFADALTQAAKDPNIIAQYSDAAAMDGATFAQSLNTLQFAAGQQSQQQQMQFENDRQALAEQKAATGSAYSGFRGQAQSQLATTENGIVQSSRATLANNLNNLTRDFESKYGTAATTPATANFTDPFAASNISLSGQYTPQAAGTGDSTILSQRVGGITGSQPIAQQNAINTKATQLYTLANATPTIS